MTTNRTTIDERPVADSTGQTILQAAHMVGIEIPAMCHSMGLAPEGACRMCLVEVEGSPRPVAACHTPIARGMNIRTATPALEALRRGLLELMLSEHAAATFAPTAVGNPFERLLARYGVAGSAFGFPAGNGRGTPVSANDPALSEGPTSIDASHTYLRYDRSLCINCRQCLNACEQVQGQFVYGIEGRGARARLIFGPTERFADSPCVACGACADRCPTGAVSDRDRRPFKPARRSVDTTCGYCGVGCQLRVETEGDAVLRVEGVSSAAVNRGHLCVKGRYAHAYVRNPGRLTTPLLRDGDSFRPVSWTEATAWAARKLTELRDRHGPDCLGVLTSARSTNEAAYLLQKLFRTTIGTNNVDCCARVCHASTAVALHRATGTAAGTASFDDVERARCIVVAGSNATEAHPVVGARIKQAALRGTPLSVIDPRRIELAEYAQLYVPVRPGTNVPLFNAVAKLLIEQRLYDAEYVAARCEGFDHLAAFLKQRPLSELAEPTGVGVQVIEHVARQIGHLRPVLFVHGIGLSELTQGTDAVMTLINLGMLTGSIGRPGAGMLPLRGQNNVQGNVDMGATPSRVTGDQRLDAPDVRDRLVVAWGKAPPSRPGLKLPEMLEAAARGALRGLWVQGFDLAQSMNCESRTLEALRRLELVIVQDIFFCELCRFAHLVLPAAAGLEQEGTFTNAERRIQLVRPVLPPPGDARQEWRLVCDVARSLGENWNYASAADVMDEIARVAPDSFGGVSHRRLSGDGLQWPCPTPEHPGTATVHASGFVRGRGRLTIVDYLPSPEQTDAAYPYLLITGRRLEHFNVGTMTRCTPAQELGGSDVLDVHPDDATREGIADGAYVEVVSRWGAARMRARHSSRVQPRMLFLTFHHPQTRANALTSPYVDPQSKCPEYKLTAAAIRALPA
jgi:formate dehydrogenase major subunit